MSWKNRQEREVLWARVGETYKKACEEYANTDPTDPNYELICQNLKESQEKMINLYNEDRKHRWDIVKFIVSSGLGFFQTIGTLGFGLTMLDFEATNSMTSKFWPVIQKGLPIKLWTKPE